MDAEWRAVWVYRGQMTPKDATMNLEIHIASIEREPGQVTIIGDASLWKGQLRIYEVRQVAIRLIEL